MSINAPPSIILMKIGHLHPKSVRKIIESFSGAPARCLGSRPCVECGAQGTGRGGGSKHPVGAQTRPCKLPSCLCCRSSGIMFPNLSQIREYVPGKGCRLWGSEVFLIRKRLFRTLSRMVDVVGSAFMGGALPPLVTFGPACAAPVPHGDPLCGPPGDSTYPTFFRSFRATSGWASPAGLLVPRGRPAPPGVPDHGPGGQSRGRRRPGHVWLLLQAAPHALPACPVGLPLLSWASRWGWGHLLVTSFQVTLRHLPQTPAPDPAPVRHGVGHGRLLPAGCLHPLPQRTACLHACGARHPPVSPREGA